MYHLSCDGILKFVFQNPFITSLLQTTEKDFVFLKSFFCNTLVTLLKHCNKYFVPCGLLKMWDHLLEKKNHNIFRQSRYKTEITTG